jgi:hypothetical protein
MATTNIHYIKRVLVSSDPKFKGQFYCFQAKFRRKKKFQISGKLELKSTEHGILPDLKNYLGKSPMDVFVSEIHLGQNIPKKEPNSEGHSCALHLKRSGILEKYSTKKVSLK